MRIVVIGTSGAGKSNFAKALAHALDTAYIELDALYCGPDWRAQSDKDFTEAVHKATLNDSWVVDGNYSLVRSLLWSRASHIVWLNFSRRRVWSQLLWRTLRNGLLRTPLYQGNRESLRMAFFSRDSILIWSYQSFAKNRQKFNQLRQAPEFAHLDWLELKTPAEGSAVLAELVQFNAQNSRSIPQSKG